MNSMMRVGCVIAATVFGAGCEDIDDDFMADFATGLVAASEAYSQGTQPNYGMPDYSMQDNSPASSNPAPALRLATSPPVSSGGPGAVVPGSYPTQGNIVAGPACPGFTEENYRTKALSGGPDQQLDSLCGAAFEYYAMYKRAIAQGYSQQDAQRTYDAHRQAAQVVLQFRQEAQ